MCFQGVFELNFKPEPNMSHKPEGATHWAAQTDDWLECWYRLENGLWYMITEYWATDIAERPYGMPAKSWKEDGVTELKRPLSDLVNLNEYQVQKVFDKVILGGFYNEKMCLMCDALNHASANGAIVPEEFHLARAEIRSYLGGFGSLGGFLDFKGQPYEFADRLAIYKDWANKPK